MLRREVGEVNFKLHREKANHASLDCMRLWLGLVLLLAGCPDVTPAHNDANLGDLAGPAADASAASDLGLTDGSHDGDTRDLALGCVPLLNEFMTGSSAWDGGSTEEFIEIYNPCPSAVDLTGWSVVYRSAGWVGPVEGEDSYALFTWPTGACPSSIPAQAFIVLGGEHFVYRDAGSPGDCPIVGHYLAAVSGSIGLRNAVVLGQNRQLVDSVGYGDTHNAFVEIEPAPPAADDRSLGRCPNGATTHHNHADFQLATTITPGAANFCTP